MKKFAVYLLVACLVLVNISAAFAGVSLSAFPDPVFREHMSRFDAGWPEIVGYNQWGNPIWETVGRDNGILDDKEIERITEIYVEPGTISLKGIEYLTALSYLNCGNHQIKQLDVSHNTALKQLICSYTPLTELDVSSCSALEVLLCDTSQLTTLKLGNLPALTNILCQNNQLLELDVRGCPALKSLDCSNNQLTELDVSGLTALERLQCHNNQLIKINASGCSSLGRLDCSGHHLIKLDVSGCTSLVELDCNSNDLTELDVSGLTALKYLNCYINQLTELDVSGLTALKELRCYDNKLTKLNTKGCTSLENLACQKNDFIELDLRNLTALKYLSCYSDQLLILKVIGCTSLEHFYYYDDYKKSQLAKLDVSGCSALVGLWCWNNKLTELDLKGCTALTDLRCYQNQLTELDISVCPALTGLNCYNNQLIKINASGCSALEDLHCDRNKLTELNLSGCSALTNLVCTTNKLTELDLSSCSALENLYCQINELTELDLSKCTALKHLDCLWNHIAELDLSKNTQLDNSLSPYNTNQIIKDLKVKRTSEGYEVDLKDYVSKLENIEDVWGEGDNCIRYDKTTGIALFSSYPKEIYYHYNTHSNSTSQKDYLMYVTIKSPMGVAVIERENEYTLLIDDMNDDSYFYFNNDLLTEDNIDSISAARYEKKGFAADGNSRLIVRVQTDYPGCVTFSLNDDIGATLEQLTDRKNKSNSAIQVITTEINSDRYQASAVLVAPETFPNNKKFPSDKFNIKVQFTPYDPEKDSGEKNIELTIKAAPILLIPGMFENAEKTFGIAGKLGIYRSLIAGGYERKYINFWNYDTSQGPNVLLSSNYNDLFREINDIFRQYLDEKIVCTKIDIITHGMGGLIARKFLSGEKKDSYDGNNWSVRSYKQGMVRRLITVAAPHLGTPWADGPYRKNFIDIMYNSLLSSPFYGNHPLIEAWLKPFTLLTNGVTRTLQNFWGDNKDNAWSELETKTPRTYGLPANVPIHAITGCIKSDNLFNDVWTFAGKLFDMRTNKMVDIFNSPSLMMNITEKFLPYIVERTIIKGTRPSSEWAGILKNLKNLRLTCKFLGPISVIYDIPSYFRALIDVVAAIYFNGEPHDLIVSHESANGGDKINLTRYYSNMGDIINPLNDRDIYAHWSICRQNDVGDKITSLLKGSTKDFTTFDTEQYESPKSAASTKANNLSNNDLSDSDSFKFVNALNLKVEPQVLRVSNNNTVKITVTSEHPINEEVFCVFGNEESNRFFKLQYHDETMKNFSAEFNAADLFTNMNNGIIEFSCLSFISKDSGITSAYVSNTVNVLSLADFDLSSKNIVSLSFLGKSSLYTSINEENYTGLYAIDDEGNYYDISSPLNGTEWTSTEFAKVNDNGCIYGLKEGTTTLTAKFKNLTASINVIVGPAIVYDDDNESNLQIITESLDKAFTGKIYNFTLKASESNNIKWSHTGELPTGLDLSESGIISGTPSKAGNYTFTVTASNGTDSASKEFTMIVNASGSSLEITTTTLKNGTDGKKYSVSLKARGAKSLKWSAENLPDGLKINESTGKISGTPKEYGNFENIIITASNGNDSIQKNFSLVINPVLPKFSGKLPAGYVYKEYFSSPLKISKGSEPITWSIKEILPPGLSFDVNTGIISGTPTQGFNGKITIVATNAAGESANKLTLKITAEKPAITSINNYGLKSAIIGENYIISCSGTGTPPLSWDFTGFPESMSYDVKTGILSGIINKSGKFKININLSNSSGKIAKKKISLQVYNPPEIITDSLPEATYKAKYNAAITATGDKTIKWRAENLPAGLKFSSKGKISGTPTAAPGNYEIIITAYNDKIPAEYSRRETSQNFKLIINNNPDPKKAYTAPQNSILANNNESDSDSDSKLDSKLESEIINEPEKIISSNENLFIGSERDINSININISDDYIIAAVLPEIHVNKSGLYELEIELDENARTDAKLYWLACPQNNKPSEDDSIAEFYDESGQEIFTVPENKLITVSVWLNKDIIYAPVILVSK